MEDAKMMSIFDFLKILTLIRDVIIPKLGQKRPKLRSAQILSLESQKYACRLI